MIQLDARHFKPRDRHPMILGTFDVLRPGEAFVLVNDHAPTPLYYQFLYERTHQFDWEYLEEGPETWRVCISKKSLGA